MLIKALESQTLVTHPRTLVNWPRVRFDFLRPHGERHEVPRTFNQGDTAEVLVLLVPSLVGGGSRPFGLQLLTGRSHKVNKQKKGRKCLSEVCWCGVPHWHFNCGRPCWACGVKLPLPAGCSAVVCRVLVQLTGNLRC